MKELPMNYEVARLGRLYHDVYIVACAAIERMLFRYKEATAELTMLPTEVVENPKIYTWDIQGKPPVQKDDADIA